MPNVKILADSTSDLPRGLAESMDIGIMPLYVLLGEKTYRDGVDIDQERIFAHFDRMQQTPTTSAPSVQDFTDFHVEPMSYKQIYGSGAKYTYSDRP